MSDYDSADEWAAPAKELPSEKVVEKVDAHTHVEGDAEEKALAGGLVPIRFKLPDGSTDLVRSFFLGQTVGYVKQQLEDLKGFTYQKITLKLGDKVMIDPLSLNDLPFTEGKEALVDVIVA
eukprot:GILI01005104.1.p2 GENE.GILI01005104.1~~GILI01005104.1.p2  ORF type:complete len:121 (+),score=53.70 GILI01005104.1:63-425(+)